MSRRGEDAWQEFSNDSEAGRLLRRLYAGTPNQPLPSYPQVHVRRKVAGEGPPAAAWAGGKLGVDPRQGSERRARERSVVVPRRKSAVVARAAILDAPRRKSMDRIALDRAEIARARKVDRPRPSKPISTETEKRRLALQFQFKGGKALPEAGTAQPIEGHVPLSLIQGKPSASMVSLRQQRADRKREQDGQQRKRQLEDDFDAVAGEVAELRGRIEALGSSNGANKAVGTLKQELSMRVSEMHNIDDMLLDIASGSSAAAALTPANNNSSSRNR